jgi:VWFA-related protein
VRLDVSVTNERGAVRGLTREDFVVEDRGIPPAIQVDEATDAPLDLALVAATLESVHFINADQTARVVAGLTAFLAQVRDVDRLAVLLADAPPRSLRPLAFGPGRFAVTAFTGGEYGAPYDAIAAALGQFTDSDRRRALVAFTNAADFRSTISFQVLTAAASRLGPALVLVGTPVRIQDEVSGRVVAGGGGLGSGRQIGDTVTAELSGHVFPAHLQRLARRTGGMAVNLGTGEPKQIVETMFTWLRSYYVITYEPPAGNGWHPVTVRVKTRNVKVTARDGYFVQ